MFQVSRFKIQENGFSLIELIIIIAISIILATIGVLNLFNYREYKDLDMTVNEIISTLRVARNYSISQESIVSGLGQKWGVHFENNEYILFRGIDYDDPGKTIVSRSVLRSTIEFKPPMPTPRNIIFDPVTGELNGSYSNTIEVLLKSNPSNFKTITVDQNGKIY